MYIHVLGDKFDERRSEKMKSAKVKESILKVTGKILQSKVEKDQSKWPPHCMGILHQPKRPCKK